MKKIFILGPAYPYRGGIAAFSERLAQSFIAQGFAVEIYTFSLQYPNFLFPGKSQFSDDAPPKNLTIHRAINAINPLNWVQVGRKIAAEAPDLVIWQFWLPFMGPCFGTINRFIKRNKSTQIISILHNIIPHEKRIGDHQFTQYFINSCDGFVSLSKSVLNDLSVFTNNQNKTYIPHPVYDNFGKKLAKDEARQWLKLLPNDKIILFFGLVRPYKGLDILLEAMADQRIKAANIKLLIAGEYYDDPSTYKAIIDQHNLHDSIIAVPNFIPNDEVRYYFCAADIVVQPYKTATQSGISQMAYHFDNPMLVTAVGGLPEIVPNGKVGYVVPPNTPLAIADALINFYTENKAAYFTEQVQIEKKRFSWQYMAEGILKLMP